ncbi:aly/REF export factor 2-like [Procambarus clarkii]|uniref:aly/REF export factor 2-like n=1 Tax=Procambarus clarkii TaxID=6728 RepID=UPI0037442DBF
MSKPGTSRLRSRQVLADEDLCDVFDIISDNNAWIEDYHDNVDESCNNGGVQKRGLRSRHQAGPAKIFISNLNVGFSRADLHDFFARQGDICETAIYYDRFGKPMGAAHVVFEKRTDAVRAQKKYDGFKLFGRKVSVKIDDGSSSEEMTIKSSTKKPTSLNDSGNGESDKRRSGATTGRGGGRGAAAARRAATAKKQAAEQLQAELEAFVSQVHLSDSTPRDCEYDREHNFLDQ